MEARIAIFSFISFFSVACVSASDNRQITMNMYHRYSEPVMASMESKHLPKYGSAEYHKLMLQYDAMKLSQHFGSLSPAPGNVTAQLTSIGSLQFIDLQLGTPNFTMLVALDTGSDLLWVPCECKECNPVVFTNTSDRENTCLIYNSSLSKTSRHIACDDESCYQRSSCIPGSNHCPYNVVYLSQKSSSSGILVKDVLYLVSNDASQSQIVVKATVTFGCGRTQTGDFFEGSMPYGVLGLGQGSISLPSMLSTMGLVENSLSVCFSINSPFGRLAFGERGSPKMKSTQYFANQSQFQYTVGVEKLYVGGVTVSTKFNVQFDTGVSFTYLASPIYKNLTQLYLRNNKDQRMDKNENSMYEFCFHIRNDQSLQQSNVIVLNFIGGYNFSVVHPIVVLGEEIGHADGYCLGVLENTDSEFSFIGQNFMSGHEIVFNRDMNTISWIEDECLHIEFNSSSQPWHSSPHTRRRPGAPLENSSTQTMFHSELLIFFSVIYYVDCLFFDHIGFLCILTL